ncbi:uncharacterized protein [Rutidosis leptorrhynchoides]|uniref:uncharacterized protein n=1 Tax=Rutidosis leptorrhynchoides TaxID=125765 RepID=UPI003A9A3A52
MENSQMNSSVFGKLMGFDETPRGKQTVLGQQKVLSENYIQKSDSIGKRLRRDSQNNQLRSKKRASIRTNDLIKDTKSSDFDEKSMRFDGIQSMTSPVVNNFIKNGNEYASRPSFLFDSQTVFGWEVKKQLLEIIKMNDGSPELVPDYGSSFGYKSNRGRKYESATKLPILEVLNFFSKLNTRPVKMTRSKMKPSVRKLVNGVSMNVKKDNAGPEEGELVHGGTEDDNLLDISSEKNLLTRSYEDGSISAHSTQTDEHVDVKVEMCQRSPSSVLELQPWENNLSGFEYCESAKTDLDGLWMQLQLLKSELEENDCDPEMVTSSDDERSCSGQSIKSILPFDPNESRDYSYLVDVLDESGFKDGDLEIHLERWHSSDIMAGPSVFETLEKKYGKLDLWHRSERRLLFDRINAGMIEILRPQVDIRVCSKTLRKKMINMLRRDAIEEELLTFLLGQEKGVGDGVSEKAVGRGLWFDPVEELDSLVREIEIFLLDQLAAELVSA